MNLVLHHHNINNISCSILKESFLGGNSAGAEPHKLLLRTPCSRNVLLIPIFWRSSSCWVANATPRRRFGQVHMELAIMKRFAQQFQKRASLRTCSQCLCIIYIYMYIQKYVYVYDMYIDFICIYIYIFFFTDSLGVVQYSFSQTWVNRCAFADQSRAFATLIAGVASILNLSRSHDLSVV